MLASGRQWGPRAWQQETLGREWKEVGGPAPATSPDITAQIRSFPAAAGRPGAAPAPRPPRAPRGPPASAQGTAGRSRAGRSRARGRCRAAGGRARSPAQPSAASPARRSTAQPARGAEPSRPQVSTERPAPRRIAATAGGRDVLSFPILWVRAARALRRCTRSALAFPQRYFCHHPRVTSVPASAHRRGAQPHSPSGAQPPGSCADPFLLAGTHGGSTHLWELLDVFGLSGHVFCWRPHQFQTVSPQPLLIARSLLE